MSSGASPPTARCPSCGWINVGQLTGCLHCGTALPIRPAEAQPAACPSCGAPPQSGDVFCRSCGAAMGAAAAAPASVVTQAAWTPTHVVPRGGLEAWAAPDASAPVLATLGARTELQLLETLGAWARVAASNGWTGWVDGRALKKRR